MGILRNLIGQRAQESAPAGADIGAFNAATIGTLTSGQIPVEQIQAKAVFNLKKIALANAAETATAEGRRPTMTDYYLAAENLRETHGEEMRRNGIEKWTPEMYADLSGQRISGYDMNKADMEPSLAKQCYAMKLANEETMGHRPTTAKDFLMAMQKIDRLELVPPPVDPAITSSMEAMKDYLDLDGDGCFFKKIGNECSFKGTIFDDVSFHPAGTCMRTHNNEENGVPIADGATFNNCVFRGLEKNDSIAFDAQNPFASPGFGDEMGRPEYKPLTMASGQYNNIRFEDINGGTITVNGRVDGMDIKGIQAEIVVGKNSSISNLRVDECTRILEFNMEPGACIAHADLRNVTVAMNSELQETKWHDVKINGSLRDVDLSRAQFSHVTFDGADLEGACFAGVQLNNCQFKNIPAAQVQEILQAAASEQGTKFGNIGVNKDSNFPFLEQMAQAGNSLNNAIAEVAPTVQAPPPSMAQAIASLSPAIQEVKDVTLNQVALNQEVFEQKRLVPEQGLSIGRPGDRQA
ncbi:MAG: pentapeptide repeat-containing protein [Rickettsiales bacterium]